MSGYGGLVELVIVFVFVLGWGLYELRSLKRDNAKAAEAAKAAANAKKVEE